MDLMANVAEYDMKGGEINQRLAERKERVGPEQRPMYDGLEALSRGQRLFLEGSKRLESWDYADAARVLPEAEKALVEASQRYALVQEGRHQVYLPATATGWVELTRAQ